MGCSREAGEGMKRRSTSKAGTATPKRSKVTWTDEKVNTFIAAYAEHVVESETADLSELEARMKQEIGFRKPELESKYKELERDWMECMAFEASASKKRGTESWAAYVEGLEESEPIRDRAKGADLYQPYANSFERLRATTRSEPRITSALTRFARLTHIRHSEHVYKIALSGGPCAGKTSVLTDLRDYIQGLGVRCFVVPEAATMFLAGGMDVEKDLGTDHVVANFQVALLATQFHLEDSFCAMAATVSPDSLSVVICDRGCMDGKAYMTPEMWHEMLERTGLTEVMLRDERYDAVCLLDTAIHAYEHRGNARAETAPEADALNAKTIACWRGHNNSCEFSSTRRFSQKRNRVRAWVEKLIRPRLNPPA